MRAPLLRYEGSHGPGRPAPCEVRVGPSAALRPSLVPTPCGGRERERWTGGGPRVRPRGFRSSGRGRFEVPSWRPFSLGRRLPGWEIKNRSAPAKRAASVEVRRKNGEVPGKGPGNREGS